MYGQGQFTPRAGSAKSVSGERAVSIILATLVKRLLVHTRMHMHYATIAANHYLSMISLLEF
jgi:hypothetical protein